MIDEGAGEYDALQLNNEFEKLGTIMNIAADHDTFNFSMLSLKENFIRSFELLSKILKEPRFHETDFKREKKKVLDKILQLKDEPSYIASHVFEKIVFDSTYYGYPEIGYENSVKNISLDDVRSFYKDSFLASDLKLVIVGNIEENEILELTEKFVPSKKGNLTEPAFAQPVKSKTKFYFVDKEDSAQSELRVGHISKSRDAEDFYPTRIMNTILGGQFSSRININLRERKGFTYGAGSSFNYLQNAGYFDVSTSVNIQNTGEAVSEILKELQGIKQNIDDKEIQFAKSYLIKQFPSRFETYTQTARNIVPLLVHSLPLNYYNGYTTELEKSTNDEISGAAINNIHNDDLIIVAVGAKNIVESQLKELAGDNLTELDIYGNLIEH